jgi:hypothetical protein
MKKYIILLTITIFLNTTQVFAGFTHNGSTITQSGTDTSLAGLSGVSGVTTQIINGQTLYFVGNNNMNITGNLTINPLTEQLVFGSAAPFRTLNLSTSGASLTIGANRIVNGDKLSTDNVAISFNNPSGLTYNTSYADMSFTNGTFTWHEGKILLGSMIIFGDGSFQGSSDDIVIDIKEGSTFESRGFHGGGGIQLQMAVPNGNINGLKIKGSGEDVLVSLGLATGEVYANPYEFILEGVYGISNQSITGQFVDVRNYSSTSTSRDLNLFAYRQIRATNLENGSATIVAEHNMHPPHGPGLVEGRKEVELTLRESEVNGSGVISDVIYFIKDYDNGDRRDAYGQTYTTDREYTGTTNASGKTGVLDVLTFAVAKTAEVTVGLDDVGENKKDRRSKYDDTRDAFDIHLLSYNHNYRVTEQQLKGVGVLEPEIALDQDANISELTKTTVDAYTTLDNLDQLYDRAKSWKVTVANLEYPTISTQPVTASGTALDLGNRNIIVDATAGSAFAINTSTNTITIKPTAALLSGAKFNNIKTTGTVSTAGGASLEFGYEDSTGINKYVALSNLLSSYTVLITDNRVNTTLLGAVTGITGDYKAHFIAPADASDIEVSVTRPSYSSFTENYPENDLSFVREINLQLTSLIAESQIEMLNLALKILQKEEAVYRALDLTNPALMITNTISGTSGSPSEANQLAILDVLNKVFVKVIANRRKLE